MRKLALVMRVAAVAVAFVMLWGFSGLVQAAEDTEVRDGVYIGAEVLKFYTFAEFGFGAAELRTQIASEMTQAGVPSVFVVEAGYMASIRDIIDEDGFAAAKKTFEPGDLGDEAYTDTAGEEVLPPVPEEEPETSTIDSVELEVREGSIEYGYTFRDDAVAVTWEQAISAEYALDADASTVTLLRDGSQVGDTVSLATLGIDASEGESGKTTFDDFMSMAAAFGIVIDFEDPATQENIPTHVRVFITGGVGENEWQETETEAIPQELIPSP